MKAWRFTGTHDPLELVDVPEPVPGPNEVVITVKAAGICHSDVGILEDEKWLALMDLPVTPGHEISGVIESVGAAVTDYAVGDRVAVWPVADGSYGYGRDGGFAEKVCATTDALVRVPDNVPFDMAAAATDSGMTSHGAVFGTGQVKPGEKVGIIGFGGLGQVGARLAVLEGAEVYVAEINEAVWERAYDAGAKRVVKDIAELADDQLDVIVDFAGFGTTTAAAIEAVGVGGRVVLVGMGKLEATINTYPLIIKHVSLLGNVGGTKDDIAGTLRWMATGDLAPAVEYTDLAGVADGIQRLARGEVKGRLIALFE